MKDVGYSKHVVFSPLLKGREGVPKLDFFR